MQDHPYQPLPLNEKNDSPITITSSFELSSHILKILDKGRHRANRKQTQLKWLLTSSAFIVIPVCILLGYLDNKAYPSCCKPYNDQAKIQKELLIRQYLNQTIFSPQLNSTSCQDMFPFTSLCSKGKIFIAKNINLITETCFKLAKQICAKQHFKNSIYSNPFVIFLVISITLLIANLLIHAGNCFSWKFALHRKNDYTLFDKFSNLKREDRNFIIDFIKTANHKLYIEPSTPLDTIAESIHQERLPMKSILSLLGGSLKNREASTNQTKNAPIYQFFKIDNNRILTKKICEYAELYTPNKAKFKYQSN